MNLMISQNDIFLLEEIVKKNFASKYKGSALGILWSVLNPLCMMIILTIVFSTLFHGRIENYPVYILSGRCMIDFFSSGVRVAMNAIKGNQNILQKTAAPKHIFIIGSVISEFLNYLITLIILVFAMIVTNAPFYFYAWPLLLIPLGCEIIMIAGFSFAFAIIRVYYTDIQHLWGVISQILFYTCAIFYPMDIIPYTYRKILLLNPIYWFIDQFRIILLYGTAPDLLNMLNLIIISLIILVIGIIIYKTYENKVAMKI